MDSRKILTAWRLEKGTRRSAGCPGLVGSSQKSTWCGGEERRELGPILCWYSSPELPSTKKGLIKVSIEGFKKVFGQILGHTWVPEWVRVNHLPQMIFYRNMFQPKLHVGCKHPFE